MYRHFANPDYRSGSTVLERNKGLGIAQSGQLDALVTLESTGTRLSFSRDDEIYAEGDPADCWYRVVSGTVRVHKLLADGRRHIAEFCFGGDCFGVDGPGKRSYSAEAVDEVIVMRYRRSVTDRLIDQNPSLARLLHNAALRDLANAHARTLLLGRMTASERTAAFLLEMFERRDRARFLDLPMSRTDIADYLGLTIETVCRNLSSLKRDGVIAIPNPQRIELRDRVALEAAAEA
jgi:CRP/FNR family transcriptional regulator, nitrogen fixation regulation protein